MIRPRLHVVHPGLALCRAVAAVLVTACGKEPSGPPAPAVLLSPSSVSFGATQGGANPPPQPVNITNSGGGTLSGLAVGTISYGSGQPTGWVSASLSGNTAPATLTLSATTGSLPAGTYSAVVPVTSGVASNSPQALSVTFVVGSAPAIGLSPLSVSFGATQGGGDPAPQTVNVSNSGGGTLSGLAVGMISYGSGQPTAWLSATLSGTTAPTNLTLTARTGSLVPGTYTATVPVTSGSASNSPRTVGITFLVSAPPPMIVLQPSSVAFNATYTVSTPAPQTVNITNGGGGSLTGLAVGTISYGSGQPTGWLSATLTTSTAPATMMLTATIGTLRPGTFTATIPVTSNVAGNSPAIVTVTFNVMDLFSAVSAGWDHSCGKGLYTAVAFCWGDNASGELGIGTTTGPEQCTVGGTPVPCSTKPVAVGGGLTFYAVSAGNFFTCGVSSMAYCWGDNTYGQLGNGSTTNSSTPVAVAGGLGLSQISVGDFTVCGLVSGGAAYCWGDNTYGQLGNGSTTNSTTPVAVAGGLTFSQVSAGASSCGITTAGTTFCWGSNASGQLGIGTTIGPQQC